MGITIAGGAVVMVALVVAAMGAPLPLLSRPADTETVSRRASVASTPPPSATPAPPASTDATPYDPSPVLIAIVQVLIVLTVALVLVVLALVIRSLLRRRPHLELHAEPGFAIPAVPTELLEEARQRLLELETGEPRNAIVAAWLGLETSAAATGLPRLPAETSSEYTERVIGVWPVDSARLGDLGALYREARFSVHPLGESHRDRAIADLRVLIADLEHVASRQAAERALAQANAQPGGAGPSTAGGGRRP
ncbi:hypothetical protein GCM10009868_12920 [Terrabacter aerolatus]|uniref:Protein-glutamine gamma-glutamyltransferase-like C-terminal domain-containing protein n=1 Tax=Terrabacter aerolatus TaxID=422442 RepID=A0A512CY53_9MICO|nr:hypothetical protein TAE01_09580 [Terrabacter aerolatus]